MITEDYVPFEIEKLLKEKGFDAQFQGFVRVTHQIARKWLREEKHIEINITLSSLYADNTREYMYDIFFSDERYYTNPARKGDGFKTYEEATEAAIKDCLENLI